MLQITECLTSQSQFILEEIRRYEKLCEENTGNKNTHITIKDFSGLCESVPIVKEFFIPSKKDDSLIRAKLFQSKDKSLPLIIYAHGGGWIYGSIESHEALCRRLALRTECSVLSVEYRLSPKYKFLIPIDDFQSVYEWALENKFALNVLNDSIIVAGDSSGGNIAAAATCRLIKEKKSLPQAVLLIYPVLDLSFSLPAIERLGFDYLLTKEIMMSYRSHYLNEYDKCSDWLVSPLFFDEYHNFPHTIIVTAECDLLSDDGRVFANKLMQHGRNTAFKCFPGVMHGFMNCHAIIPESEVTLQWIVNSIKNI